MGIDKIYLPLKIFEFATPLAFSYRNSVLQSIFPKKDLLYNGGCKNDCIRKIIFKFLKIIPG
jgi:hypothetical protein